ncbi:hypothetical protein ALC57_12712, partial [Trachymyrmex cornetzi]
SVRCRTTTADKSVSSSSCSVSRSSITTPSSAVRFKILVYLNDSFLRTLLPFSRHISYCIYSRRVELVPHASDPIRTAYHQLLNLQFRNVILAVVPAVEVLRVKVLIVESEDLLVDLTEALA